MDWLSHNGSWLLGAAVSILTYISLVRANTRAENDREERHHKRIARDGLKFELMWRDYAERKEINGHDFELTENEIMPQRPRRITPEE